MVEVSHKRAHNKWQFFQEGGGVREQLQGLVVGPVLLNRLITDGNEEINSMLIKFTDSAKLGNIAHIPSIGKAIMSPEEVWYMVKTLLWFIQLGKLKGETNPTSPRRLKSKIAPKAVVLIDMYSRSNQNLEASSVEST